MTKVRSKQALKLAAQLSGFCLFLFLSADGTEAQDDSSCEAITRQVPLESSSATAGTFANLAGRPGSLNAETNRLLSEAIAKLENAEPPAGLCPAGCSPLTPPQIIFSSVPNRYLEQYSEKARCAELLTETEHSPIRYQGREFSSREALQDWFYQLSTGKGKDGEDLYRRCPGSCSPRYKVFIDRTETSTFRLNADVICGHARDKSDNQYRLEASYRWSCAQDS